MLVEIWDHNITGFIDRDIIKGVMEIKKGTPGKSIRDVQYAVVTSCGNFTVGKLTYDLINEWLAEKHNGEFVYKND